MCPVFNPPSLFLMGQFNLRTYVSITDMVEEPLIEIFHTIWHSILFLCSSNYPFNFLLLICINSPQSVFPPDCLYIFQKPFNYLLILLFTYYITTFDLCNPPPCLDLAEINFSWRLCSHFSNYFPVLISSVHLYIGEHSKYLWKSHTTSEQNRAEFIPTLKHPSKPWQYPVLQLAVVSLLPSLLEIIHLLSLWQFLLPSHS